MLTASHAVHGADPVTVILAVLAAAGLYAVSLFACPTRRCRTCGGTGARLTRAGRRYRGGRCRRCRGTGRIRRIGATAVHRFWWSAAGDRIRQRRRAAHQARQHADYHPGPQPTDRRNLP